MTPTTKRATAADATCVAAVDIAREAADLLEGADKVGEHAGYDADGERLVTHYFACTMPAYNGWRWAVTVARASRSKTVTVDEVVLLPGADALLAPEWVPFSERLRPGDLGVGDLLPTPKDDPRLVPGYTGADETLPEDLTDVLAPPGWEVGVGRVRVLSELGRDDAADRWYTGDVGPTSPMALAAQARCSSCGFLLAMSGTMRQAFGVCANEYSPSDGRAVSLDYGCGAHSETVIVPNAHPANDPIVDEVGYDMITVHNEQPEGSVEPGAPAEDLGHS